MECILRTTKEKILKTRTERAQSGCSTMLFFLGIRMQSQRKSYKMKPESLQKTPSMKGNGYFE